MLNNMQPVNEEYLKVCQMNGLKLMREYSFTTDLSSEEFTLQQVAKANW